MFVIFSINIFILRLTVTKVVFEFKEKINLSERYRRLTVTKVVFEYHA